MEHKEKRSRTGRYDVISTHGPATNIDELEGGPVNKVLSSDGASTDRTVNAPLAKLLAEHFTVFNYDCRGRGDSDDTAPYPSSARSRT